MNLRRKLFTIFGSLALLALASGGVTLWSIAQWSNSEERLQGHYQRSLLVLQVKAANYRAVKELLDAVVDEDDNAREEFEEILKPVEADLQTWAGLAHNDEERQQVQQVRQAYVKLIEDARAVFYYTEQGRRDLALRLIEDEVEETDFPAFESVIRQAVESDQQSRQIVLNETQNTRQTSQFVLMLSAFGILSLVLLLAAYLSADLFAPLRQTEAALDDVARGNTQHRLDEEREDELGRINRAFNRMIESIVKRQQNLELPGVANLNGTNFLLDKTDWNEAPSRLTLHQLVSQLRTKVSQLSDHSVNENTHGNTAVAVSQQQMLMNQIDQLLQVVARITEFGFPLDLNLSCTDIRVLLHEVLLRFQNEFVERNINFELIIAPDIENAVVDRLKLREVLAELVRHALSALPERGGRIGIRTYLSTPVVGETQLLIEVANNGMNMEKPLIERSFAAIENSFNHHSSIGTSNVGLRFVKDIVEQHGGFLKIDSQPGVGTVVQIQLPWREA